MRTKERQCELHIQQKTTTSYARLRYEYLNKQIITHNTNITLIWKALFLFPWNSHSMERMKESYHNCSDDKTSKAHRRYKSNLLINPCTLAKTKTMKTL